MTGPASSSNEQALTDFFSAFARLDAAGMAAHYDPEVVFRDPVFGRLEGDQARKMWAMLCSGAREFHLDFGGIRADETSGQAWWTASYTFSGTGRQVVNRVRSQFRFRDGRIVEQRDRFSLRRWSAQALGPAAQVMSAPGLRRTIRRQARTRLRSWDRPS